MKKRRLINRFPLPYMCEFCTIYRKRRKLYSNQDILILRVFTNLSKLIIINYSEQFMVMNTSLSVIIKIKFLGG